ncbi:hypothetical protein BDAP_000086 [Binucleata daphniae]
MVVIIIYQKTSREDAVSVEKPNVRYSNLFNSTSERKIERELLNGLNKISIILQNSDNLELFTKFIESRAINFANFMQDEANNEKMKILNKFSGDLLNKIHKVFKYKVVIQSDNVAQNTNNASNNNKKSKFIFAKQFEEKEVENIQNIKQTEMENLVFLNTSRQFINIVKEIQEDTLNQIETNDINKYAKTIIQRMYFLITHLEIVSGYFVQKNEETKKFDKVTTNHAKRIFSNVYDEKYNFGHLNKVSYDQNTNKLYIEFTNI